MHESFTRTTTRLETLYQRIRGRAGRVAAGAAFALLSLTAPSSAGGPAVSRYDALPRAAERLPQPIWLPHCHMRIVEWRSTVALRTETTPSDPALAVIDDTCRDAFERYGSFLDAQRLPRVRGSAESLPAISMLPGNTLLDGKAPRALNDMPSRFESVAPGCCYWGLYVDSLNHLFLRNDPLVRGANGAMVPNPRFVRTLTHEISHVLSARLGVWEAVGYDRKRDEDLAEAFVGFMGMRFPAESSAEDLAYHRGRTPVASPAPELAAASSPAPELTAASSSVLAGAGAGAADTNAQR